MTNARLVLCSTAAHRAALLSRLGLPFEVARPPFDETGAEGRPAAEIALAYAAGKALSLAPAYRGPGDLLLAADQVTELDGEVLRKAESPEACAAQLARLSGRAHTLHAAVALLHPESGRLKTALAQVRLTMRPLSPAQIARYVEADRPLGSAGGYTFEGRGVALFERVEGSDDSAIVGLPLLETARLLREFGLDPLGSAC